MLVGLTVAATLIAVTAVVAVRITRLRRLRDTVCLRRHVVSVARRRRDDGVRRLARELAPSDTGEVGRVASGHSERDSRHRWLVPGQLDAREEEVTVAGLLELAERSGDPAATGLLASEVRRAGAECTRAERSLAAALTELDDATVRWNR